MQVDKLTHHYDRGPDGRETWIYYGGRRIAREVHLYLVDDGPREGVLLIFEDGEEVHIPEPSKSDSVYSHALDAIYEHLRDHFDFPLEDVLHGIKITGMVTVGDVVEGPWKELSHLGYLPTSVIYRWEGPKNQYRSVSRKLVDAVVGYYGGKQAEVADVADAVFEDLGFKRQGKWEFGYHGGWSHESGSWNGDGQKALFYDPKTGHGFYVTIGAGPYGNTYHDDIAPKKPLFAVGLWS